jgi:DDE family transposase
MLLQFAMTTTTRTTSIHKVRRDVLGGKRGAGHEYQRRGRRIRRPDPRRIRPGPHDSTLTGVAGLVELGRFAQEIRLDAELKRRFGKMKTGPRVVYPMPEQLRLLLDGQLCGESRVLGLEALAADRLFVHLAGGTVPSIDTVYRDLCRFDARALTSLEDLMVTQSFAMLSASPEHLHVDIDTTVEPLFGRQQGALPGPNPRYHGRPSYHPLLATVAEVGVCVGAKLRPGDCSFGTDDVPTILRWIMRLRRHVGAKTLLTVRMDSAGDCSELLEALEARSVRYVIKLKATEDLLGAALMCTSWRVTQLEGDAVERVAVLDFQRSEWRHRQVPLRVIALRSTQRGGQQLRLWEDCDDSVQFYVTNDWQAEPESIPREYDGRAEIEPIIDDLKHGVRIGNVPSHDFNANHAMFLSKLLAHNLLRRFAGATLPRAFYWRTPWLLRALICRPGRLIRSGRCWTLRTPPTLVRPPRE